MRCFIALVCFSAAFCSAGFAQEPAHAELKRALDRSESNKPELIAALRQVPAAHRAAMEFLITNMPDQDLRSLSAEFLLKNVRLAYAAREATAWGRAIPEDVFLNNVLPYANVDEPRDEWRETFMERFLPVVAECGSASEAAQRLNQTVFGELGVRYSTQRQSANQSPQQSTASGLASCTGLSIILADACRAVGVPARLAGVPQWTGKRGNHTWVEIWDGQWHFTGAAEPSSQGLNHTWFQGDAARAQADDRLRAVYAASFRRTGTSFPLVWAPQVNWVPAVNVTRRYTSRSKADGPTVSVRVWNAKRTARVAADVHITRADESASRSGRTRDEGFDLNDMLTFPAQLKASYIVSAKVNGATLSQRVVIKKPQTIVDLVLPEVTAR